MKRILAALAAILVSAGVASAANLGYLQGPLDPSAQLNTLNQVIGTINTGVTPQTMGTYGLFRNYLDNGAMAVSQRGTAATAGGTTSGCVLAGASPDYVADRWCIDTNVSSGAGDGQVITATPSPPTGFTQSMKVYRSANALTQPICAIQEIPNSEAVQLQGQAVILSVYLQALAGMTGNGTVTGYVLTGTGVDEGLQTMTASPAVTPAFTGLATAGTMAAALNTTSPSWVRFYSSPITIAAGAKEAAVEFCFTPAGSSSGTTDGFAMTGAQLEVLGVNSTLPSPFEYRPYSVELAKAERYYYQLNEPAAGVAVANGSYLTATICDVQLPLPVPMRVAPLVALGGASESATTWEVFIGSTTAIVLASTYLVQDAAVSNSTTMVALQATTTSEAVSKGCTLAGAAGGAKLLMSADF